MANGHRRDQGDVEGAGDALGERGLVGAVLFAPSSRPTREFAARDWSQSGQSLIFLRRSLLAGCLSERVLCGAYRSEALLSEIFWWSSSEVVTAAA